MVTVSAYRAGGLGSKLGRVTPADLEPALNRATMEYICRYGVCAPTGWIFINTR